MTQSGPERFSALGCLAFSRASAAARTVFFGRRRHAEGGEQESSEAILRIVSSIDDYLYTNEHRADGSRRSIFSGPNREKLMGGPLPPGADAASEWERLIHPDDFDEHLAHRARLRRGEPSEVCYRLIGYDGVTRWVKARTKPHHVDGRVFVEGIVSDVTRQLLAEQELAGAQDELRRLAAVNEHQALHDALTGLGNRRKLLQDLEHTIMEASESAPCLLVLFDLDGFKQYNDTFGHPAGDALLALLGAKLQAALGGRAASYRLGGDEFCVLLPTADSDVETSISILSRALTDEGESFTITSSFGAVFLPAQAKSSEEALHLADQRLYNAKRSRSSRRSRPHDVLLQVLLEREPGLHGHTAEVAELARAMAVLLDLDEVAIHTLDQAALMHDIGKLAVPDAILQKPGPLDDSEREVIKRHTIVGERILSASPMLTGVAKIVRATHERHDGSGYPDGLAADEIPLEARVVSVCNAYSALTSDRPYRRARSHEEAVAEIRRCSGTQFDPVVVESFLSAVETQHSQAGSSAA